MSGFLRKNLNIKFTDDPRTRERADPPARHTLPAAQPSASEGRDIATRHPVGEPRGRHAPWGMPDPKGHTRRAPRRVHGAVSSTQRGRGRRAPGLGAGRRDVLDGTVWFGGAAAAGVPGATERARQRDGRCVSRGVRSTPRVSVHRGAAWARERWRLPCQKSCHSPAARAPGGRRTRPPAAWAGLRGQTCGSAFGARGFSGPAAAIHAEGHSGPDARTPGHARAWLLRGRLRLGPPPSPRRGEERARPAGHGAVTVARARLFSFMAPLPLYSSALLGFT